MRRCSAAEAAARVRSRDTLAVPLGPGQPVTFLRALGEREAFDELTVFGALLVDLFPLFARPGVQLRSGFFGPAERALRAAGHDVRFVPSDFRGFVRLARQMRPRVMATSAALPGDDGSFSLSLHAGATVDELRRCGRDPDRLLVVETHPDLPRTLGLPPDHPHRLTPDEVDLWIEGERPPITLPDGETTPEALAIAEHVRPCVRDGATLQTGIGAIPNAVARLLAEGEGRDYGIHSEMFTDGLMHLHQAGKIANRKGVFDDVSVCTFALGSRALYAWLHDNAAVRFLPVEVVNDPHVIAANHDMVSINGALQIDLRGQVVADAFPDAQHSGIGGHEDFIEGSSFSEHGRSLICLPSTASVGGRRVSRIVPRLPAGSVVTTPRHRVNVVVTEHGRAEIFGLTTEERAEALTAIAHPDLRDALRAGKEDPSLPS